MAISNLAPRAIVRHNLTRGGENYEIWSQSIKTYLMANDLWGAIDGKVEPEPGDNGGDYKTWQKKNAMALCIICATCDEDFSNEWMMGAMNAKEIWDYLRRLFGRSEPAPAQAPAQGETSLKQSGGPQKKDKADLQKDMDSGDWSEVKKILDRDSELLREGVSHGKKTVLHQAVAAGHEDIVENLLQLDTMTADVLQAQEVDGYTVLAIAARRGLLGVAKLLVEKNANLVHMVTHRGELPVVLASASGHDELTRYLYTRTDFEVIVAHGNDVALLTNCIAAKIYDVAMSLLKLSPGLAMALDAEEHSAAHVMAQMRTSFSGGNDLVFWKRWIYSYVSVQLPELPQPAGTISQPQPSGAISHIESQTTNESQNVPSDFRNDFCVSIQLPQPAGTISQPQLAGTISQTDDIESQHGQPDDTESQHGQHDDIESQLGQPDDIESQHGQPDDIESQTTNESQNVPSNFRNDFSGTISQPDDIESQLGQPNDDIESQTTNESQNVPSNFRNDLCVRIQLPPLPQPASSISQPQPAGTISQPDDIESQLGQPDDDVESQLGQPNDIESQHGQFDDIETQTTKKSQNLPSDFRNDFCIQLPPLPQPAGTISQPDNIKSQLGQTDDDIESQHGQPDDIGSQHGQLDDIESQTTNESQNEPSDFRNDFCVSIQLSPLPQPAGTISQPDNIKSQLGQTDDDIESQHCQPDDIGSQHGQLDDIESQTTNESQNEPSDFRNDFCVSIQLSPLPQPAGTISQPDNIKSQLGQTDDDIESQHGQPDDIGSQHGQLDDIESQTTNESQNEPSDFRNDFCVSIQLPLLPQPAGTISQPDNIKSQLGQTDDDIESQHGQPDDIGSQHGQLDDIESQTTNESQNEPSDFRNDFWEGVSVQLPPLPQPTGTISQPQPADTISQPDDIESQTTNESQNVPSDFRNDFWEGVSVQLPPLPQPTGTISQPQPADTISQPDDIESQHGQPDDIKSQTTNESQNVPSDFRNDLCVSIQLPPLTQPTGTLSQPDDIESQLGQPDDDIESQHSQRDDIESQHGQPDDIEIQHGQPDDIESQHGQPYDIEGLTTYKSQNVPSDFRNDFSLGKFFLFSKFGFMEHIIKQKLRHTQARELLEMICQKTTNSEGMPKILFLAIENGLIEFVTKVCDLFPDMLWCFDEYGRNPLSFAVLRRQEKIFNLLYEMGSKQNLQVAYKDKFGNNMLHHAAMLAPPLQLRKQSGAALQFQRELLWFQEVEKIVNPKCIEARNMEGRTPRELFTIQHDDLRKEGERWMRDTASSGMIAATLIATMTFTAAFTVPGGNDQNTGFAMFLEDPSTMVTPFLIFIIADALSLVSSTASVLSFLGILTTRYAEEDFRESLPRKMIFGLAALLLSITTMMVAFCATLFVILHKRINWVTYPIAISGVIPVLIFLLFQSRLLSGILKSTYGPGIFYKKNKKRVGKLVLNKIKKKWAGKQL